MHHHPIPSAHVCTQPAAGVFTHTAAALPPGASYAGTPINAAGQPTHHLILLADRPEQDLNWQAAMEWAASVGGDLPTPQEQALLFANCRPSLPEAACWSNHEQDASFAWSCTFGGGHQSYDRKSFEGSAVAVRRLPLESFNAFVSAPSTEGPHESTHPTLTKSEVNAIRKRLDRWELDHLRKLAQEQADRLEAAHERIEALESEASRAWDAADSWRTDAMNLASDLEAAGRAVGLTQGGQLVATAQQGGAA